MSKTKSKEYETYIRARITNEQKEKLNKVANDRQTTYSDLIRDFIEKLSESTKSKLKRSEANV